MKDDNLKEIYNFLFEFSSLFHQKFGYIFHKDNIDSKYACNKNQNKTMLILGRKERVTPTMLGKYLDMKKGSLTTLIDSLENMNLIYREIDQKDRRQIWICLTEEGKEYVKNKMKQYEKDITSVLNSLEDEDIKVFATNMQEIVTIMKKL